MTQESALMAGGPTMGMANRLEMAGLRATYREQVRGILLPFWCDRGFDRGSHAFVERLDFHGREVADVPRRAMVQARQIYVFAHAARVGVVGSAGERAEAAMQSLLRRYLDDNDASRGFAFSVDSAGRRVSDLRDSYSQAFILFALAAAYRLSGSRCYLDIARATNDFVERCLIDPDDGGLFDSCPVESRLKRQNPVMHLLEAYLELHEATCDGFWLDKASGIVDLFSTRLLSRTFRALPERFACNWTLSQGGPRATVFEPGHHFEWVWLLAWFDAAAGADHSASRDLLWRTACDHGLSSSRFCLDEVGLDYRVSKASIRLWPHTEGVKAARCRMSSGDPAAAAVAVDMYRALLGGFLGRPFAAGWIDHVDAAGAPMVDYVPASSLYHIYCASIEPEWSPTARHD
jgi:mannose/cellobiose epimerase-like protein (N-acyl-D-glucosamine 2-epimerase family)